MIDVPVKIRSQRDPTAASGIVNIMTTGVVSDSNTEASIM